MVHSTLWTNGPKARAVRPRAILSLLFTALVFLVSLSPASQAWSQQLSLSADPDLVEFTPYPLRPPDLSSPRETLRSFIKNVNEAIERWRSEASRDAIRLPLRRALQCLDLTEFPLATREAVGIEKALLLKEILDRIEIPPFEDIPGSEEVREEGLTSWSLPNTELTVELITEGPRGGAFQFNRYTVASLEDFYALTEFLPYKPGASIGVYEDFFYGPGPILPNSWVSGLPEWSYVVVGGQTIWQWLALILLLALVALASVIVYRCGKWWDNRFERVSAWFQFGRPLTWVFLIVAMPVVSLLVEDAINITDLTFVIVESTLDAVRYIAVAWLALLIILRGGEGIIHTRQLRSASVDSQLIRTVARLVAIVVVIYIGVIAADFFGVPVAPIIAGLGIGGLAIALAVRPTLENIIGGFILFADKPVRVGDFCSFGTQNGTVEEIGLRSTRIRALDRTIVSIPNAEFANMQIINWASCDTMLIQHVIGLRYETKPEQLRHVLVKLREMLAAHPKIEQDTMRVRLVRYGESSQEIEVRVYVMTANWNEFFAVQEDVLLRVGEIVEKSGTSFAVPSRTLYLGRDKGLDAERSAAAMQEVESWRRSTRLPFPHLPAERREHLADTLDYPPRGSPDALRQEDLSDEQAEPLSRPRTDETEVQERAPPTETKQP